jgi:hypothetical protein
MMDNKMIFNIHETLFNFPRVGEFLRYFSNAWKTLLLLVIATFSLSAFGAEVSMTVNPPIVSLDEAALVSIVVRKAKKPSIPVLPRIDGLVFSGASKSSQHSWVNGKTDRSTTYTLRVHPQKTGEFVIGPFNYKVDGETKQLTGKLKVVATSGEVSAAQSWSDVTFARITANRQQVYVQEPFELTLSIYSRTDIQLARNVNLQGLPETGLSESAWKEVQNGDRKKIDGVLYNVRQFKTPLRAIGSGTFKFAPLVTVQVVAPQQQQQRRDLFGRVQTLPVELAVEDLVVNVLPLPTLGKPDGFSGAVGRFQFEVTADPKEVNPGDPITLQMTIVGEGNYDRIQPPTLPVDAPFRLFGDTTRQQGNNGVRFEQVISPRDATLTEIPPIGFSYFDSQSKTYRTIRSPAIPITVNASSNNTAQLFVAKDSITIAPADTPFATESDVQRMSSWFKEKWNLIRPWLWTLPAALGAGLALFFAQRIYHWRRKDIAWMRRQKAPKAARQALRTATQARNQGDVPAFYNALWTALADYFGNRLNLAPGEISAPIVLQVLQEAASSPALLQSAQTLFEQVDAARYSPPSTRLDPETAEQQQTNLTQLLKQLEKTR